MRRCKWKAKSWVEERWKGRKVEMEGRVERKVQGKEGELKGQG